MPRKSFVTQIKIIETLESNYDAYTKGQKCAYLDDLVQDRDTFIINAPGIPYSWTKPARHLGICYLWLSSIYPSGEFVHVGVFMQ